eukprot:85316_1
MALHCYLLLAFCVISYINADATFNATSANLQRVPNNNVNDHPQGVYLFITTFFDLLWYIVGLVVFCICSISCLCLFYIQQRKKHPQPHRPISCESTRNTQRIDTSGSRCDTSNLSNGTVIRKETLSTQSTALSVASMTKSPTKSPPFPHSVPSAHSKNPTYSNYSNCSLSVFSGVDSEGIDLDDHLNTFSEYNVFNALAPISEQMNSSPSNSSHSSDSDSTIRPKPLFKQEREETRDDETEDGDTSLNIDLDHREDSMDSSESSADTANPMTIIAMMKKRANKKSPRAFQNQARSTKYKRRYAQTIDSETEFDRDFV